jgi:hypothetical protein
MDEKHFYGLGAWLSGRVIASQDQVPQFNLQKELQERKQHFHFS